MSAEGKKEETQGYVYARPSCRCGGGKFAGGRVKVKLGNEVCQSQHVTLRVYTLEDERGKAIAVPVSRPSARVTMTGLGGLFEIRLTGRPLLHMVRSGIPVFPKPWAHPI